MAKRKPIAPAHTEAADSPPTSRADYVHQNLRKAILSGDLRPGTAVLQDEVAARLGVSITPVREALRRLEATGLVTYEAHRGATVAFLSNDALAELYLLRSAVEGLGARLAATRVTEEQIIQLEAIQTSMEERTRAGDVVGLSSGSREFHSLIAKIGGPAYLASHLKLIWESSPVPTSESIWAHPHLARHNLQVHADLIGALREGAAERAGELMSGHVLDVIEARKLLKPIKASPEPGEV